MENRSKQPRPKSAFLPDPADVDTSGWIRATSGYAGLIALSRTNSESTHASAGRTPARMQHVSSRPAVQRRPHTSGEHIRNDSSSPDIEICPSVAMLDFATYAESIHTSRQPPRQSALGTVDANGVSRPPVCDWGDWMNENSSKTYQRHSSPAHHGKGTPGSGSKFKKFWRRLSSNGRSPAHDGGSPIQSNKRRATSAHYRGTPHPRDGYNQRQSANAGQVPISASDPFPEVKDPTFDPSERQPRRLVKKIRPASSPAPAATLYKPPLLQEPAIVTRCYAGPSGIPSLPPPLPSALPPPSMAELPGSHRMQGSGPILTTKATAPARPEPRPKNELPDDFYPLDSIGRELATARFKLNMCCDCGQSPPRQGSPTCDWCGETRRRMLVAAPSHTSSISVFRPSSVYGTMSPYDHDDDDVTTILTQTASEVVEERRSSRAPAQLKPLEPVRTGYELSHPQQYQSQFQQYKQLYEDQDQDKQPFQKQAPKQPPKTPPPKKHRHQLPSQIQSQPKQQYQSQPPPPEPAPPQQQVQHRHQYPTQLQHNQQYESQLPPPAPLAPPASLAPPAPLAPPASLAQPAPPVQQQQQQQHRQQYQTQLLPQPNQQYQSQLQSQPKQQYESQPPPAVPAAPPQQPQQHRQQYPSELQSLPKQQYPSQAHPQIRQPYPSQLQLKQQYQQTQLQYAQEYQNRHEQQLQQQLQLQLEQRLQQHLQSQNPYTQEYQVTYCPQCRGPKESPRLHLCDHCYTASLHQWAAQRRW
ncbi:hypothetical protein PspLS_00108 [Pyricularia sp. CBS 133598]|nr:hypothetical protein PspLS_00108 [Pyricularia sp. CBS 133598]